MLLVSPLFFSLFLLPVCFYFPFTHAIKPSISSAPFLQKSNFSLYLVPLPSLGFACGSWVGFWSDLRWFDLCFGGSISSMVVWYVLRWGFVVLIDFRFCFSFPGWYRWCSCGFVIWLWFWWLGLRFWVVVIVAIVVVAMVVIEWVLCLMCCEFFFLIL